MPEPITMALLGSAIGGQLFNAFGQNRQAAQARRDTQQRQNQVNQWTQQFLSPTQSEGASWLSQLMAQTRGQGPATFTNQTIGYNPFQAQGVDTSRFDPAMGGGVQLPSWINTEINNADPMRAILAGVTNAEGTMLDTRMGDRYLDFSRLTNPTNISGAGFNRSQDALMQLINGNGGYNSITAQLDPTNGMALNEIVQGNTRFDMTPMFGALAPMEDRTRERALLDLNAQAGSLGARMGTAMADRSADLLTRLTEEANLRRQQLAFQASEAAQGRRLQASELLNARDNILNQVMMADQGAAVNAMGNRIQGAGVASRNAVDELSARIQGSSAFNNAIAGLLGNAMDSQTRLALGNQSTGANISMFNAGAANAAELANARAGNDIQTANAANMIATQGQRLQQGLGRNTFNMQGAQLQDNGLQRLAQLLQFNTGELNRAGLANATNQLNADTNNAQNNLSAFLANQTAQQNWFGNQLSGNTTLMNDFNAAQNRALQAIGIRAGVPIAPPTAGVGMQNFGTGMGDLANLMMMMQYMGRGNSGGGTAANVPRINTQYWNF